MFSLSIIDTDKFLEMPLTYAASLKYKHKREAGADGGGENETVYFGGG